MNRRLGGGASRFHRNISVSQDRNEKRRKGTLLCFRKYLVWKKILWVGGDGGGGGDYHVFRRNFKGSQCRKIS